MKKAMICCGEMGAALTKGHSWARQIYPSETGDLVIFTYAEDQGGENSKERNVRITFCPFCGRHITYENARDAE